MKWSWRIASVFGIDVKIHLTFIFALVWGAFLWGGGGPAMAAYGVFLTLVLFFVVVLHELGHSLTAQRYGIPVHDIVLLPIGGVARLGYMPEAPVQELVIALAGPLVNLVLSLLALPFLAVGVALRLTAGQPLGLSMMTEPGFANFFLYLFMVNVTLFLFNMLPAFPMDGGRVLRALLAMKFHYSRATAVAVNVGRVFAVLFGLFGILTANIFMAVVAMFVFNGAGAERQEVAEREQTKGVDPRMPVLFADTPADLAFDRLIRSPYPALAVVNSGGEFVGVVTRTGMERGWAAGIRGAVGQFVEPPR